MIGPDGVDYGDGFTIGTSDNWTDWFGGGEWYPRMPLNLGYVEGLCRRPMTQAEKDAEAQEPKADDLVVLVADEIIRLANESGGAQYTCFSESPIKDAWISDATRIIEIVRAHDAKQKAGE